MAKKNTEAGGIGVMCAIPFLLSLLGYSAVHYVGQFTLATLDAGTAGAFVGPPLPSAEQLNREITDLRSRIEEMQEILHSFESGSETLSAVRNELEELIQVANNLRAKLAELERRLAAARVSKEQLGQAQAAAEQAAKAHIVLQNACEDLRRRIRELKDQVAALQREINEREGAMLVRPPRGTDKKPTFVDCDKSGIRIMPQGLRLPVKPDGKDYESMTAGADREELLKHARSTGLVLFLVRPDGFASFRAYRACIETCNKSIPGSKTISIGYEPVNSDWKLRYPKE